MYILDAALAFALTMLVVATVVTQIVRLLRNTAKLRNSELQKMLKEYFDKELQPVVQRELNRLKTHVKTNVTNKVASELVKTANNLKESELFSQNELGTLVEVSTEELMEQLKRSTLGQKLLTELGDQAQAVFDELGRRYEVVGGKFTESFRKHSRLWTTGVALVLALVINIDSVHIADSYIRNKGMRQGVIVQMDAIVEDYTALVESLEKEKGKDSFTKEELEQAFGDSKKQLDVLKSLGFPIGWSYFPHSVFQEEESKDFKQRNNFGGWIMWVLGILLTALLAGLGAPFWYDTVTGISRVVLRARAVKKPSA